MSENNEKYEIKPRTERNIWLVGWGRIPLTLSGFVGSFNLTNSPDISFRSLHSHVLSWLKV